jgi:hypothetical protein
MHQYQCKLFVFVWVHTLPAAKILPGADDDLSVMTVMNGNDVQDDVPPPQCNMLETWNMQEMERLATTTPPPASVSDSGSSECSDDVPLHHDSLDESELGEFLMDTFTGVDVMAAMDDMTELTAI